MEVLRGEVWWANLPVPERSEPGYQRPVVIVQSDRLNRSRIATVAVVSITTNMRWANAPGNVLIPASASGLRRDAVANASQLSAVDRSVLVKRIGRLSKPLMADVDIGLRLVLALDGG